MTQEFYPSYYCRQDGFLYFRIRQGNSESTALLKREGSTCVFISLRIAPLSIESYIEGNSAFSQAWTLRGAYSEQFQVYLGKLTTDILGSYFVSMCNRWINRYALPLAPAILYRFMNLRVYGNLSRLLSPCGEPISIK